MTDHAQEEATKLYDRLNIVQLEEVSGNEARQDIEQIADAIRRGEKRGRESMREDCIKVTTKYMGDCSNDSVNIEEAIRKLV
jgi:septum formation topological specificity factor MinE